MPRLEAKCAASRDRPPFVGLESAANLVYWCPVLFDVAPDASCKLCSGLLGLRCSSRAAARCT
eukprot:225101-Chlamydomonas_euryale.AAC.1